MAINQIALFLAIALVVAVIAYLIGRWRAKSELESRIEAEREDAIKRSRAALSGQFSEQLAPYLPNFPYKPTEARFIGKPIDFIFFKGMDNQKIDEVVFVEVKSGSSTLSTQERRLRDAINEKKVSWEEYSIPQELTAKKGN